MKVLIFGSLIDIIGKSQLDISDIPDTDTLHEKLTNDYPELANCTYRYSVNKKLSVDNTELDEADEIALLPPFAGG